MEIEDRVLRKRSLPSPIASPAIIHDKVNESDSRSLESSLKKVKISLQVPGQLRLTQDVSECGARARELGFQVLKIDPKNPLNLSVQFSGQSYLITVDRHYPHRPPIICALPTGERIMLPILSTWLPVHTIANVLDQLVIHINVDDKSKSKRLATDISL